MKRTVTDYTRRTAREDTNANASEKSRRSPRGIPALSFVSLGFAVLGILAPGAWAAKVTKQIQGRLSAIDPESKRILVVAEYGRFDYTIAPDTEFRKDGNPVGFEALRKRQVIRVKASAKDPKPGDPLKPTLIEILDR